MSKIHVLESNGNGSYHVLLHVPIPNSSNAAGVPWSTIAVLTGLAKTVLTIGDGIGQMTSVEKALVDSGSLVELSTNILLESAGNPTVGKVTAMADAYILDFLKDFQIRYKFYGMAQG